MISTASSFTPSSRAMDARPITGPYAETEDRIGRVSQLIVEYFDGAN